MISNRLFKSADFLQASAGDPIRSVVTQSQEAVVVAWYVQTGQNIAAHVHPQGQDTWTILSGAGFYQLDEQGSSCAITVGDVLVAPVGAVHGVFNPHPEPLIFISVVTPAEAGYQLL